MIGAAVTFLAIGTADLVAGGLRGIPVSRRRAGLGVAVAAVVALAGLALTAPSQGLAVALIAGPIGVGAWLFLRLEAKPSPRRAWLALGVLALHLGLGVGTESLWSPPATTGLGAWLDGLAFPALNHLEADSLLLVVGLFVFLAATTNAVVRLLLVAAGTRTAPSEERLRGGRMIGVLERWMILALMLAGHPTAAGLVVSAKSLLRFPELNRVAAESPTEGRGRASRVDHVTEYFLLGSLSSWLVAVLLALLFVGPF